ncbi:MAG: hypothetical protein WA510_28160 [Acidobacteriaceae bacterium]
MKTPAVTLALCFVTCSMASAKDASSAKYMDATYQETHAESVRLNCYGTGDSSMSTCHDSEMLVYTVKVGEEVYTLTPYKTLPHRESLWRQPEGATVAVWNDGKRLHIRIGPKESQYDIIGESAEDATR